jgi:hypothetical protein
MHLRDRAHRLPTLFLVDTKSTVRLLCEFGATGSVDSHSRRSACDDATATAGATATTTGATATATTCASNTATSGGVASLSGTHRRAR